MARNRSSLRESLVVRSVEEPPYIVDDSTLRRYDQRNLIFNRIWMDPKWPGHQQTEEKQGLENIEQKKPGYTRIDYALAEAAWTVHDVWNQAFSSERLQRPYGPSLMGEKWYEEPSPIHDTFEITRTIKRAARFYGADLVGVTVLNKCWIYANRRRDLEPITIPDGIRYALVMAIAMDRMGIATSPEVPAAAATGLGYSKMAFTASSLAEFVRNLGYTAIPAGNDLGLSIPMAIDAGLGQLGRNGLLITPEHGPRVRLCKILTDLPLEPDSPIDFGLSNYCKSCSLCAEACEVDAISKNTNPNWDPVCQSNNPGVLKWYVDSEKCYQYWCENGTDCSTCISICPFNDGPIEASTEEFWENLDK